MTRKEAIEVFNEPTKHIQLLKGEIVYSHIEFDANLVVNEMRKSISNGTPLPKGHGRLKDFDKIEVWL